VINSIPLCLEFDDGVSPKIQARMSYAFRIFAAIYGYEVSDRHRTDASLCCIYGRERQEIGRSRFFHIPARYVLRQPEDPPPAPLVCSYGGEDIYLFYGRDKTSGNPDWLGEIFEWLSSADEMSFTDRDSIGRVPFEQSLFGRHSISPQRPHASLIMAWFQHSITSQDGSKSLPVAPSPVPGIGHLVICSCDIDFYFAGRWGVLGRVLKNMVIAILITHSFPFFRDNLRQLVALARGGRVGDFLPQLLNASREHGFSSTFFVLVRRRHRRDSNYTFEQIAAHLPGILKSGSSIALHGSYESVVENSDLDSEVALLEAGVGVRPRGSRQHWLRFDRHTKLFANVEKAGLLYDSSLGFAEGVGFRNGAAFAFPPYNFELEEPYSFLVIPLAIMDVGLASVGRLLSHRPAKLAATVLKESRRWGWGGIALLWHNPIEPLEVPDEINQIFWREMETRAQHQERWISAEEFVNISLTRYQRAGLMTGVQPVALSANGQSSV
jgi:hypothetical protein